MLRDIILASLSSKKTWSFYTEFTRYLGKFAKRYKIKFPLVKKMGSTSFLRLSIQNNAVRYTIIFQVVINIKIWRSYELNVKSQKFDAGEGEGENL